MISYKIGDIFDSIDQTLVNPVNTVGVMGKGLALEFKKRYPAMFERYKELCNKGELKIGVLYLYRLYRSNKPWVLNFPTKKHWGLKSRLEYIEKGLKEFGRCYTIWGIKSISFPQLGCGYGKLKWSDVMPLMKEYLSEINIPVTIYV